MPNQLSADPCINQNKNILEEENRILKEKLRVIDRERQDLRLILEARELHEDEERNEIRKEIEQVWELERMAVNRLREKTHEQLSLIKEQTQAISNMKKKIEETKDKESFETKTPSNSSKMCSYKMKLNKFLGAENEDYDVWWEDLQAFFQLYTFSEEDKKNLFNAHLGGEARRFIQNEDLSKINSVEKLHQLLRGTFSDKYDWQNVLMNIKQKPGEKIRPFSLR